MDSDTLDPLRVHTPDSVYDQVYGHDNGIDTIDKDTMPAFIFPTSNDLHTPPLSGSPLFTFHTLKTTQLQPLSSDRTNMDWIFGVLLFCYIVLAWVQVLFGRRFAQLFQSLYSEKRVHFLIRDGNLFNEQIALGLGIIYLFTFSLFFFLVIKIMGGFYPDQPLVLFLNILGGLIAFLLMKWLLIKGLSAVFLTGEATSRYLLNSLIFNLNMGIILLPIVIIMAYIQSEVMVIPAAIIVTILFIYKLLRGLYIGISYSKFSVFYLFLYLCTVEILPIVIIAKVLFRWS